MKVTDAMVDRVLQAMHDHGWIEEDFSASYWKTRAEVRLFLELALREGEIHLSADNLRDLCDPHSHAAGDRE